MQKYPLTATLEGQEDKPLQTVVDGRDLRHWEAENDASFIETPLSYTVLADLCYYALNRQGKYDKTLEQFSAECISVEEDSEVPKAKAKRTRKTVTGDK